MGLASHHAHPVAKKLFTERNHQGAILWHSSLPDGRLPRTIAEYINHVS